MPLAVPPGAMKISFKEEGDDDCNDVDPHGAPVKLLIENGSARRRRDRRQRTFKRHEHLTMKVTFMSATYHVYYMNGVTETTVGHGPTGADEAYLYERTIVTRGLFDINKATVAVENKMTVTRQSTRALTVSSRMPRRPRDGNGDSAPQAVRSIPSDNETPAGTIYRKVPIHPR